MKSTTKITLAISLPVGLIALLLAAVAWWTSQEFESLRRSLVSTNADLRAVSLQYIELKKQLAQAESLIAAGAQDINNTRSALLQAQRSTYDHEKMLSTLFTIQRSGDSLVAFKRSDHQQAFSVTVAP